MSDTAKIWFVHDGAAKAGPFSQAELQARFDRGEVALSHFLWREGMPTWKKASELGVLNSAVKPAFEPPVFETVPAKEETSPFFIASPALAAARTRVITRPQATAAAEPVYAASTELAVSPAGGPQHHSRTGDDLSALIEVPVKDAQESTGLLDVGQLRNARREAAKAIQVSQSQQKLTPTPQFARAPEEGMGFMPRLLICLAVIGIAGVAGWFMVPESYVGTATNMIQKTFSSMPAIKDVSPEELTALTGVVNAGVEQGVRADFALSTVSPEAPVFYVVTNQPKGTQLILTLDPVLGSLVGDAPGTIQVTLSVTEKVGKTAQIHAKDGSALPMGDYKADLKDKDGRVLISKQYFVGGTRDVIYTTKLNEYMSGRRAKALAETQLYKSTVDKLDALAAKLRTQAASVARLNPAARDQAWAGFEADWNAKLAEIDHDFQEPARIFTKLQRSLQDARGSLAAVYAARRGQVQAAAQRNVASASAQGLPQLMAVLTRDIADARERLEGANKSASGAGYIKEESL